MYFRSGPLKSILLIFENSPVVHLSEESQNWLLGFQLFGEICVQSWDFRIDFVLFRVWELGEWSERSGNLRNQKIRYFYLDYKKIMNEKYLFLIEKNHFEENFYFVFRPKNIFSKMKIVIKNFTFFSSKNLIFFEEKK